MKTKILIIITAIYSVIYAMSPDESKINCKPSIRLKKTKKVVNKTTAFAPKNVQSDSDNKLTIKIEEDFTFHAISGTETIEIFDEPYLKSLIYIVQKETSEELKRELQERDVTLQANVEGYNHNLKILLEKFKKAQATLSDLENKNKELTQDSEKLKAHMLTLSNAVATLSNNTSNVNATKSKKRCCIIQ